MLATASGLHASALAKDRRHGLRFRLHGKAEAHRAGMSKHFEKGGNSLSVKVNGKRLVQSRMMEFGPVESDKEEEETEMGRRRRVRRCEMMPVIVACVEVCCNAWMTAPPRDRTCCCRSQRRKSRGNMSMTGTQWPEGSLIMTALETSLHTWSEWLPSTCSPWTRVHLGHSPTAPRDAC